MTTVREFTVEAGRPDTISEEKLVVLKERLEYLWYEYAVYYYNEIGTN